MKLGLISDVHGDPIALELAWAHLTLMGADRIVCAGDVVGYGPFPDRVIAFLRDKRIFSVRGNHDRWALERGTGVPDEFGGAVPSDETLDYLKDLPFDLVVALETEIGVIVHGSPRSDMEFVQPHSHPPARLRGYVMELNCNLLVVGHTHRPMSYRCREGLVVNPGSVVSLPNVESSRTFAMVHDDLDVSFHDVESGSAVAVGDWS